LRALACVSDLPSDPTVPGTVFSDVFTPDWGDMPSAAPIIEQFPDYAGNGSESVPEAFDLIVDSSLRPSTPSIFNFNPDPSGSFGLTTPTCRAVLAQFSANGGIEASLAMRRSPSLSRLGSPLSTLAPGPLSDTGTIMSQLSQLNLDLHARTEAVRVNRQAIVFGSLICNGFLQIDGLSFLEFLQRATQDFVHTITRIYFASGKARPSLNRSTEAHHSRWPTSQLDERNSPCEKSSWNSSAASAESSGCTTESSSAPTPPQNTHAVVEDEVISQSLALVITGVYVQILDLLYMTILLAKHRFSRAHIDPIRPIEGIQFGSLPLIDGCTQGIVFAQIILNLLERAERYLGIGMVPVDAPGGILTREQMSLLLTAVDEAGSGRSALTDLENPSEPKVSKPELVRNHFQEFLSMLRQLTLY
jgi:hypothetical protein